MPRKRGKKLKNARKHAVQLTVLLDGEEYPGKHDGQGILHTQERISKNRSRLRKELQKSKLLTSSSARPGKSMKEACCLANLPRLGKSMREACCLASFLLD